jgi:thiaminase
MTALDIFKKYLEKDSKYLLNTSQKNINIAKEKLKNNEKDIFRDILHEMEILINDNFQKFALTDVGKICFTIITH